MNASSVDKVSDEFLVLLLFCCSNPILASSCFVRPWCFRAAAVPVLGWLVGYWAPRLNLLFLLSSPSERCTTRQVDECEVLLATYFGWQQVRLSQRSSSHNILYNLLLLLQSTTLVPCVNVAATDDYSFLRRTWNSIHSNVVVDRRRFCAHATVLQSLCTAAEAEKSVSCYLLTVFRCFMLYTACS